MTTYLIPAIVGVAGLIIGAVATYLIAFSGARSKAKRILAEAEAQGEVMKKNKLLEVKEKFLNKKAELEKEVAARSQKLQQAESRIKQRELQLNQQQSENQRKRNEIDAIKANLDNQLQIVNQKQEELSTLQKQERERLETISGLSAEDAREQLVESLKEEAKTQAASSLSIRPFLNWMPASRRSLSTISTSPMKLRSASSLRKMTALPLRLNCVI